MVMKKCNQPGCPRLVDKGTGKCEPHRRQAEARRGSSTARGYGTEHRTRFREGVLARDPICVECHRRPSKHADHYPHSREDLIALGLDPNDPAHGRGLCHPCHSAETARNQPGGWNAQQ